MSEAHLLPKVEPEQPPTDERSGRYLIFRLAHGEFGAPSRTIREVMEMQKITSVPNAPNFIAGVMNLRGKVIPVVDLRFSFGLPCAGSTPDTCIVVVRVTMASTEQTLGILVDAVTQVLDLRPKDFLTREDLDQASELDTRDPAPYLLGAARTDGQIKLLLDLDELLNNLDPRSCSALSAAA